MAEDLAAVYDRLGWEREDYVLHDPSRIVTADGRHWVAVTGKANEDGYACGLELWSRADPGAAWEPERCLFTEKPAWVGEELPGNGGAFWAPDFVTPDLLFYSVSDGFEDGAGTCLGVARREGGRWHDMGAPISCAFKAFFDREVSVIDPSATVLPDGRLWLVTGGGLIHGQVFDRDTKFETEWYGEGDWVDLVSALGDGDDYPWVEAAFAHARGGWYYLFFNTGACCSGLASTYEIRVGRSRAPLGPFVDRAGLPLLEGGGSLLLSSDGDRIGPGHVGIWTRDDGVDVLSYHYYDRRRGGLAWLGERELMWQDGWPVVGLILTSAD